MRVFVATRLWTVVMLLTKLKRKIADAAFILDPTRRTM